MLRIRSCRGFGNLTGVEPLEVQRRTGRGGTVSTTAPERNKSPMSVPPLLTEYWTDSEEDIPSNARLEVAFETVGIIRGDLSNTKFELNESLLGEKGKRLVGSGACQ